MPSKAFVAIDTQNDITKHYRDVIDSITAATRAFKPGAKGADLVSELKAVSRNVFTKMKGTEKHGL